ncbi:hypothetical protein BDR26DRAFT_198816 [Obelidium mucronatum]|nr:hypothetical protein BDR26DRAFT_198816 [Obelidium mucronatum]
MREVLAFPFFSLFLYVIGQLQSPFVGLVPPQSLFLGWIVFAFAMARGPPAGAADSAWPLALALAAAPLLARAAFGGGAALGGGAADFALLSAAVFLAAAAPTAVVLGRHVAAANPRPLWRFCLFAIAGLLCYFAPEVNAFIGSLAWQYMPSPPPTPAELLGNIAILISLWGGTRLLIGGGQNKSIADETSRKISQADKTRTNEEKTATSAVSIKKAGLDLITVILLSLPVLISYATTSLVPQYSRTLIAPVNINFLFDTES